MLPRAKNGDNTFAAYRLNDDCFKTFITILYFLLFSVFDVQQVLTGVINYVFRQAARNGSSGRPCVLSIIFAASLFYCRCWSQDNVS